MNNFSSLESFSVATGVGAAVYNEAEEICFISSVYEGLSDNISNLISLINCEKAEKTALAYAIKQSQRFGGRYIFLAPSGLTYCASPLTGKLRNTASGVVAGPFLMTNYEDYLSIDVIVCDSSKSGLIKAVREIPFKTPVQARAICEMLALCAERCGDASGPFSVPYNEALAASLKHMDVLSKAVTFIKNNYMNKITLSDIAEHVFLSPTYFSKIFREETGQSPGAFITAIRIDASKRLLRDPSVSLITIPERTGFENQSYFTRVFKKEEGLTPGEYRKNTMYN